MTKQHILRVVLILALCSFPMTAFASEDTVPEVTTLDAEGLILKGRLEENNASRVGFEYGRTQAYDGRNEMDAQNNVSYSNAEITSFFKAPEATSSSAIYAIEHDNEGNLLALDANRSRVYKFDSSKNFIDAFGQMGDFDDRANGKFSYPYSVGVDPDGFIYVLNTYHHRLDKFTPDYQFLYSVGGWGPADHQMRYPDDLDIDAAGNLYVLDSRSGYNYAKVKVFNKTGGFVRAFGTYGTGPDQLSNVADILLDHDGNILVTSVWTDSQTGLNASRIQKFSPTGTLLSVINIDGENSVGVNDIKTDSEGNIYLLVSHYYNFGKFEIKIFNSQGEEQTPLIVSGSSMNGMNQNDQSHYVYSLYIDEHDGIYVGGKNGNIGRVERQAQPGAIFTNSNRSNRYECETLYNYRAFAYNDTGVSYGENKTFISQDCIAAPQNVAVDKTTVRTASLSWGDGANSNYRGVIQYRTGDEQWTDVNADYKGSFTLEGLTPSSEYEIRIAYGENAENDEVVRISNWSNILTLTTMEEKTYTVSSCEDLQNIGWNPATDQTGDLEGKYLLDRDLDCSETRSWNSDGVDIDLAYLGTSLRGFVPIGDLGTGILSNQSFYPEDVAFRGTFDGQGHSISGIYQRSDNMSMHGLFATLAGAQIKNLTLNDVDIQLEAGGHIGGLAGFATGSTIEDVAVNGSIATVEPDGPRPYSSEGYSDFSAAVEHNGEVFILEKNKVVVIDSSLSVLRTIEVDIENSYYGHLEIDGDGNLYVANGISGEVTKYSPDGTVLWTKSSINKFDVKDGIFYATQGNTLTKYDYSGQEIGTVTLRNDVSSISALGVSPDGKIYVGAYSNLTVYSSTGTQLSSYDLSVLSPDGYFYVNAIAPSESGTIYLGDANGGIVHVTSDLEVLNRAFDSNGNSIKTLSIASDGKLFATTRRLVRGFTEDLQNPRTYGIVQEGMVMGGGLIGGSYSERQNRTTISRSSADIDMNFSLGGTAIVSGLGGYGMLDVYDSYSAGDIELTAEIEDGMYLIGGIGSYIMGSVERSYYSGNITIRGTGITFVSGLVSYGQAVIKDSFSTGSITSENPSVMAAGIAMYLTNESKGPSYDLVNNYYDSSRSGADICALGIPDSDSSAEVYGEPDCNTVNEDGNDNRYFLGSSTAGPLSNWDFENVWVSVEGKLPTLIPVESNQEPTPPTTTPPTTAPVVTVPTTPTTVPNGQTSGREENNSSPKTVRSTGATQSTGNSIGNNLEIIDREELEKNLPQIKELSNIETQVLGDGSEKSGQAASVVEADEVSKAFSDPIQLGTVFVLLLFIGSMGVWFMLKRRNEKTVALAESSKKTFDGWR